MNILILNSILFTADNNIIPCVKSIKDTMIYNMCLGFKELGHTITLAAASEYKPTEREVYDFEILFFPSKFPKLFPPSVLPYSPALKKYLKKRHTDYDIIISSETFSFPSLFAAQLCPHKTLIWQELTEHQRKFAQIPSKIWHNFIAKFVMNKILGVVPRSNQAKRFIQQYMKSVSTQVIDHGINIEKFNFSVTKNRQVISSSQLIYRKNIDGIIRIFQKFHQIKGYEDIKLIIAGRGEEEKKLKQLTKELGIEESVNFTGFLSQRELNQYIKQSYCFLINTRKDLNMVSIPESIVSGTPILTNLQPASVDYIQHYKLGITKNNWDENDLREMIDKNDYFVSNCINYRQKLTSKYSAQLFINVFNQLHHENIIIQ